MTIMQKVSLFLLAMILVAGSRSVSAQDSKGAWSVGADFFNRYNWRGSDYGNSPVIQPTIKYTSGGFSMGTWGSYSLSGNTTATEADLFLGYAFKKGFSLLVTDYYFPSEPGSSGNYFDYNNGHIFEVSASQAIGKFNVSGNYYFANAANDLYFEAGYTFKTVNLFLGAGNKSYSESGEFNVVNLGISTTKTIAVTDKFSLPLIGKVILNPNKEQIFLVLGFTL
jgi:hypothetical protein